MKSSLIYNSNHLRIEGLFLDCDGTIADTEIPITLEQFNRAFIQYQSVQPHLPLIHWSESEYAELLKTGDSKQRYLAYFEAKGCWPNDVINGERSKQKFAEDMQRMKNDQFETVFSDALQSGKITLRPGIEALVRDAFAAKIPIVVCSNSNTKPVREIVNKLLIGGANIPVFGGDQFTRKKPYPDMYHHAAASVGVIRLDKCVVLEDSNMGLSAAMQAGMKCVITKSLFTRDDDFSGAHLVCNDLVEAELSLEAIDRALFGDH